MKCMLVIRRARERIVAAMATFSSAAAATAPSDSAQYKRAVMELNGLQTDAALLACSRSAAPRETKSPRKHFNLAWMQDYLERTGLAVEELHRLNVIHIAGTKGKGSVSAMCESILRAYGLKTGFYSSPHLLEVRERIRINGRPLGKADFVSVFWDSFEKLKASSSSDKQSMPSYFRMLTVMAFHAFLKEKVDVAIIEVGIGGAYDCTNIVEQPVVCAITSLGYDHTHILGNTLAEIAWQKGGIIKPGRPTFTLPQPAEALRALAGRARELNASSIHVVPELTAYPGKRPTLALSGRHQWLNGSLAVQVCREWLKQMGRWAPLRADDTVEDTTEETVETIPVAKPFSLPPAFYVGLQNCHWAGRSQVLKRGRATFFLDGAHTPGSVTSSAEWFVEAAGEEVRGTTGPVSQVLMFNITRKRDPTTMLAPLVGCGFDCALFTPNIVDAALVNSADNTFRSVTVEEQCATAAANSHAWTALCSQHKSPGAIPSKGDTHGRVFRSIREALDWLSSAHSSTSPVSPPPPPALAAAGHVQVLVTGSLHLVGDVMEVLGCTIDDV